MAHICQKGGFQLIGLFSAAPCLFKFTNHVLPLGNIIYTNHDTVNISCSLNMGVAKTSMTCLLSRLNKIDST